MLEGTCRIRNIHALLVGMRFGPAIMIISVVVLPMAMSSNHASCTSPGYIPKTLFPIRNMLICGYGFSICDK